METDFLLAEDRGAVRLLTINRPKQLNALNVAIIDSINQQIDLLQQDEFVRAVVIKGAGDRAFAAGADVLELENLSPEQAAEFSRYGQTVFERLESLPVPVIAAVNGFALGGGLELALACDFIYASEESVLGLVESNLGLIPGYAGVSRLVDRIGESRAREALYMAQKFSAQESLSIGLVNRIFSSTELIDEAVGTAQAIADKSRGCIKRLKRLITEMRSSSPEACKAFQYSAFGLTFADQDAQEGIQAFKEKRKPKYNA